MNTLCMLFNLWCSIPIVTTVLMPSYDVELTIPCVNASEDLTPLLQNAIDNLARIQPTVTPSTYAAAFSTEGAAMAIKLSACTYHMSEQVNLNDMSNVSIYGDGLNKTIIEIKE